MIDDNRSRFAGALAQARVFDQPPERSRPAPASLPPLFGRASIVSRIPHLAVTLGRLHEMCLLLGSSPAALDGELQPPQLLADLSRELTLCFAAEESDAYYGVIIEERPSLLPRVSELEREHSRILKVVEALHRLSAHRAYWRELAPRAERLLALVHAHELAEQQLLRELFLGGDGRASSPSGTYARAWLGDGKSPLLVLVVDDERAVRVVVRRMLESVGCRVVEAADAPSALRVLEERQNAVSAIVSDVGLPGMLGPELVRAASVICPHIATLLMSGEAHDELVAAGRVAPDVEVLEKPFLPEDMLERLASALERRRSLSSGPSY
jgi:CheY-like chemotaxis protein